MQVKIIRRIQTETKININICGANKKVLTSWDGKYENRLFQIENNCSRQVSPEKNRKTNNWKKENAKEFF